MNTLLRFVARAGSMALFALFLLTIWACDFGFDVSIGGKKVDISSVRAAADSIAAQLKVSAKTCKAKETISGVVGDDGCITIKGTFCGQDVERKICGFQPRTEFTYVIEIDGGGMAVLQVPMAMADLGTWSIRNDAGATGAIEFSDTPFGYRPAQPFVAEPGKRLVYARYREDFTDTLIDGDLLGTLRQSFVGIDTVKLILLSTTRLRSMPGGPPVLALDSNYVFAELPAVYDFALVGPAFSFPVHFVETDAAVLSDAQAATIGLPTASMKYALVSLAGAQPSQVDSSYTLATVGPPAAGRFLGTSIRGADTFLLIRFDRSEFFRVVDSTSPSQAAVLRGQLHTATFPWGFSIPLLLSRGADVAAPDGAHQAFAITSLLPNPARDRVAVGVRLVRGGATLRLFDAQGRMRRTIPLPATGPVEDVITLETDDLAPGMYVVELAMPGRRSAARLDVVR